MARKNFGVSVGRPPATAASKMGKPPRSKSMSAAPLGAAPSDQQPSPLGPCSRKNDGIRAELVEQRFDRAPIHLR